MIPTHNFHFHGYALSLYRSLCIFSPHLVFHSYILFYFHSSSHFRFPSLLSFLFLQKTVWGIAFYLDLLTHRGAMIPSVFRCPFSLWLVVLGFMDWIRVYVAWLVYLLISGRIELNLETHSANPDLVPLVIAPEFS